MSYQSWPAVRIESSWSQSHVDIRVITPSHAAPPARSRPAVAKGAEMCMRRRVASSARARPMVPIEPTACCAASYSAVQLLRGPRGQDVGAGRQCSMTSDDRLSSRIRCHVGLRPLKIKVAMIDVCLAKGNAAGSMSLGHWQSQCFLLKECQQPHSISFAIAFRNKISSYLWSWFLSQSYKNKLSHEGPTFPFYCTSSLPGSILHLCNCPEMECQGILVYYSSISKCLRLHSISYAMIQNSMFCPTKIKGTARIVPDTRRLQLHNSFHFFCAHSIYCTFGDSALRDRKVLMHSALQYVQQLRNSFLVFLNFPSMNLHEGPCQVSDRMLPIFVIFSVHSCSTHQSLEVIFVGYDWKCLYVMYCIKRFVWFCCCMLRSLRLLV